MTTDEYQELIGELEAYTRLSHTLAATEAEFQAVLTDLVSECYKDEFLRAQQELAATEERIEHLVLRHPEWFAKCKTLKTPFGSVATRSSTKLEVANEETTIALLELRGEEALPYLRERKFLSIEALEGLDDGELARLKVARVTRESITISPAKVDLGKAVKMTEKGGAK